MILAFPSSAPLLALGGLCAGLVLGLAYFASLRRNVRLYADGRPVAAGLLQAGRFALLAGALAGIAQFGGVPLLASALGLLAGRWAVMRRTRKASP
jgi:hypothetical protein